MHLIVPSSAGQREPASDTPPAREAPGRYADEQQLARSLAPTVGSASKESEPTADVYYLSMQDLVEVW